MVDFRYVARSMTFGICSAFLLGPAYKASASATEIGFEQACGYLADSSQPYYWAIPDILQVRNPTPAQNKLLNDIASCIELDYSGTSLRHRFANYKDGFTVMLVIARDTPEDLAFTNQRVLEAMRMAVTLSKQDIAGWITDPSLSNTVAQYENFLKCLTWFSSKVLRQIELIEGPTAAATFQDTILDNYAGLVAELRNYQPNETELSKRLETYKALAL